MGDGTSVPLPPGALSLSIREYYWDWREAEPATFTIECLDDDADPPAARRDAASTAAQLRRASTGSCTRSSTGTPTCATRRPRAPPTPSALRSRLAKGLDAARYSFCFWDLGPDEALVTEVEVPPARYWSLQLYEIPWFELVDVTEHVVSLNHTQARVDDDGMIRLVVSHRDPGVPNWLDAGGSPHRAVHLPGLLDHRRGRRRHGARVVPVEEAAAALPAATPSVDAGRAGRRDGRPAPPPGLALPHLNRERRP